MGGFVCDVDFKGCLSLLNLTVVGVYVVGASTVLAPWLGRESSSSAVFVGLSPGAAHLERALGVDHVNVTSECLRRHQVLVLDGLFSSLVDLCHHSDGRVLCLRSDLRGFLSLLEVPLLELSFFGFFSASLERLRFLFVFWRTGRLGSLRLAGFFRSLECLLRFLLLGHFQLLCRLFRNIHRVNVVSIVLSKAGFLVSLLAQDLGLLGVNNLRNYFLAKGKSQCLGLAGVVLDNLEQFGVRLLHILQCRLTQSEPQL